MLDTNIRKQTTMNYVSSRRMSDITKYDSTRFIFKYDRTLKIVYKHLQMIQIPALDDPF